jgi:hypothetical protein
VNGQPANGKPANERPAPTALSTDPAAGH